jgi:hypothetical protein
MVGQTASACGKAVGATGRQHTCTLSATLWHGHVWDDGLPTQKHHSMLFGDWCRSLPSSLTTWSLHGSEWGCMCLVRLHPSVFTPTPCDRDPCKSLPVFLRMHNTGYPKVTVCPVRTQPPSSTPSCVLVVMFVCGTLYDAVHLEAGSCRLAVHVMILVPGPVHGCQCQHWAVPCSRRCMLAYCVVCPGTSCVGASSVVMSVVGHASAASALAR